eukprot:m.36997 g.36997  ORF g.36997 m.36997 type:complete len:458 (+) comp11068_c0_seq2:109-1482(+)
MGQAPSTPLADTAPATRASSNASDAARPTRRDVVSSVVPAAAACPSLCGQQGTATAIALLGMVLQEASLRNVNSDDESEDSDDDDDDDDYAASDASSDRGSLVCVRGTAVPPPVVLGSGGNAAVGGVRTRGGGGAVAMRGGALRGGALRGSDAISKQKSTAAAKKKVASVETFHNLSYRTPPSQDNSQHNPQGKKITLKLINHKNKCLTIRDVGLQDKVQVLRAKVQETYAVPLEHITLLFGGRRMADEKTLSAYGLVDQSQVSLILTARGGPEQIFSHFEISVENLDYRYDFNFTNVNDKGRVFSRGNVRYSRPVGCERKAIKVLNMFESNAWLASDDKSSTWPVAYHGTAAKNVKNIHTDGLKVGGVDVDKVNGDVYGQGVYVSPLPEYALGYATKASVGGQSYRVVFQCRVKPGSYSKHNLVAAPWDKKERIPRIWVIKNTADVRPYGICFFPC